MKKVFLITFIFQFIIVSCLFCQSDSLNFLIEKAIQSSPKIKMLELKKDAAKLKVIQSSNLPDPILSFGISNLPVPSFSFTKEPMTEKMIGLRQEFPFPGKLKTMAKSESKEIEMIELEIIDAKNQIRKQLVQSYNELRYIRKSIEVFENTEILLKNMLEVVKTQFITSKASQQNLLRIELELTKLSNMIDEKRSMEQSHLSMINSFLLRERSSPIQTNDFPMISAKEFEIQDLIERAKKSNPMINSSIVAKEKSQINEVISRYERLPMFAISAKYSFRDKVGGMPMDDLFSFMVDVSLPLNYGGKVTAKIEETQLMQNYYERQYQLTIQMLNASLSASISKLNSLQFRIKLIEEGMLIQAKENLKIALIDYQVGKIDFINVIDALMELLKIEDELYRLKADYLNELAEIEYQIGSKLNFEN